jgi:nitroreductase
VDIYEAIEKRRTIRKFKGPATEEQIKRIILAGMIPGALKR